MGLYKCRKRNAEKKSKLNKASSYTTRILQFLLQNQKVETKLKWRIFKSIELIRVGIKMYASRAGGGDML